MADEPWLKDAKEKDSEVDLQIWSLEQLAEKEYEKRQAKN